MRYLDATLVTAGLASLGFGLYLAWPPAAFIVVGAILAWMGWPD